MRSLILMALMACLPANAGEVYKCKGPKGDITYTNIKCPEHTDAEHYATYQPEPEVPPAPDPLPETPPTPPPPPPAASSVAPMPAIPPIQAPSPPPAQTPPQPAPPIIQQVVQQPAQHPIVVVQESAQTAPPATDATAAGASGYKCSEGEEIWMQSTPCPAVAIRPTSKTAERPQSDAQSASQSAPVIRKTPVTENAPSQGTLCDQLISQASNPRQQTNAAGIDERDKLLAANGCKR